MPVQELKSSQRHPPSPKELGETEVKTRNKYMCQDSEKYLLPVILIGAFCIYAGYCTVNPSFRPPTCFFLLEDFSKHPA